jgi:endonuclease YncB( thermonuclease family)
MLLAPRSLGLSQHGAALLTAAAIFAAGLTLGALIGPGLTSRAAAPAIAPVTSRAAYPAEVVRVIDGDTFEARVRVWPGMEATPRVRLRGIDAPEMKARCEDERVQAVAARDALARMLAEGAVAITNVGQDKYGGRVDADVSTGKTINVGDALLDLGLARRYDGGRRAGWCDAQR